MSNDLQKLVIQFQMLEANLKALQERAEMLNGTIEEIEKTKIAIEDLKQTKPNKTLIPLGSGSFISGKIEDVENIIIGIGNGVAVSKRKEDAVAILNNRLREIEDNLTNVTRQITKTAFELEKIQEEAEKLQK